ncbi:MAG: M28 family metallopeptidase [Actinomycetota bacterium]|nr:M28 family metallopeptidase [Actinomycetota bacterium]
MFSTAAALERDKFLSVTIGPRPAGSEGETKAADYIESEFRSFGFTVERQPAKRLDGGTSFNIIATDPSADANAAYILLGGHYDTVPPSPGGNDNGTGIAVLLTVAEQIAGRHLPIRFVAFAGEEIQRTTREHHIGSRALAASLKDPKAVKAMLSVDQVGFGQMDFITYRQTSLDLLDGLQKVCDSLAVPYTHHAKGNISDHVPFAQIGIPSILFSTTDIPQRHTPQDTFDRVDPAAVDRAGRVLAEWIRRETAIT